MNNETRAEIESWIRLAKKKPNYSKLIGNRKGEPDNQKLYDQVKADAQKKFDVYPSAVANGWVVQEYKRRGGTYHKPVTKGDVAGHAFHGNQYTDASDSASDAANYILKKGYAVPRNHELIAQQHRDIAKSIEDGMKGGKIPLSKWNEAQKAIDAHNDAATAHDKAAEVAKANSEAEKNKDYSMRPQREAASAAAAKASEMAGLATAKATGTYLARMARDAAKQGESKDYTDYLEQSGKEQAAEGDLSGQTQTYTDEMATNISGQNEWR